jgi:hypothetical protein
MGGGWPFYMPGFFALTLAIAWWWRTRTWRRRLQEGLSAFVIASVFALVLTPLAAQSLERLLEARGIVGTETVAQNVSWATLLRAGLTIVAWTLFVGCGVLAVQRRRPLILLGAVPGFVVLHLVRVGEAGSLIQDWTARAGSAAPAAWLTVALIPLTAWAVGMIAISRPQS